MTKCGCKACGCRIWEDPQWGWKDKVEFCSLHSAAPEMLEALKKAVECIGTLEEKYLRVIKMKEAILKAEGME